MNKSLAGKWVREEEEEEEDLHRTGGGEVKGGGGAIAKELGCSSATVHRRLKNLPAGA